MIVSIVSLAYEVVKGELACFHELCGSRHILCLVPKHVTISVPYKTSRF